MEEKQGNKKNKGFTDHLSGTAQPTAESIWAKEATMFGCSSAKRL
jgi:hypothetical protein